MGYQLWGSFYRYKSVAQIAFGDKKVWAIELDPLCLVLFLTFEQQEDHQLLQQIFELAVMTQMRTFISARSI